jgi:glycosyltransferase involved in cell wall biosynthesis
VTRAAFVFPNPRAALAAEVADGRAPDSTLLGQNHLDQHGVTAELVDPPAHDPESGLRGRVRWHTRELALPRRLADYDVAFTPLLNLFPLASRALRGPRVVTINYGHALIYERSSPARRSLVRASLRSAARVVCLGEWQREHAIERIGVSPERIVKLLVPIDERFYGAQPPDDAEQLVLTVGKDDARDFRTFAEAVDGLDARVQIVAPPRNLRGVRLPANATAGRVDAFALRDLYRRASVVVVPQRRDGYPYGSEGGGLTALVEAEACARPLVVSERAVLRDYVDDGENALVVPAEDPRALRDAIERVLGDRALARRLGGAGRARVERAHTTRGFAAQLAPVLEDANAGR